MHLNFWIKFKSVCLCVSNVNNTVPIRIISKDYQYYLDHKSKVNVNKRPSCRIII